MLKSISIKKDNEKNIFSYYAQNIKKAIVIFIIGMIIGVALVVFSQNNTQELNLLSPDEINITETPGFIGVFLRNFIVSIVLALGFIYGRIVSEIVLFLNGIVVGIVMSSYIYVAGGMVLLTLLPHGILELPCILYCASMGMSEYKEYGKLKVARLVLIIVILLILAALIEVKISLPLALNLQDR